MKTNSMIFALVSSLSLFAGAARAQEGAAPTRGAVAVQGPAAKAVVAGPVAIHAYSAFSGAKLYVVSAVSGTDRDCAGARLGEATSLAAEKVHGVTVGAGQLACVETSAARGSEILWHAQKSDRAAAQAEMIASRR